MPAINISRKFLLVLSLIYIYLPISIFLLGWTKPCIAMSCLTVLYICAARCRIMDKRSGHSQAKGRRSTQG